MEVDQSSRGTGKTTRMIQWMKDNPDGVLYVINDREMYRLRDEYDPIGSQGIAKRILAPRLQPEKRSTIAHGRPVAIDNADMILSQMFGDVKVVSMNAVEPLSLENPDG